MHSTQMVGAQWDHVPRYEHRAICQTCGTVESMEHILIRCKENAVNIIWRAAKNLWPHDDIPWPNPSLGIALGAGAISLPKQPRPERDVAKHLAKRKGAVRLLRILISEAAHMIWVLRCERVIQDKTHHDDEIKKRWTVAINRRLTDDKIVASKIKRDRVHVQMAKNTWERVLRKEGELPDQWIHHPEVLVGTRV